MVSTDIVMTYSEESDESDLSTMSMSLLTRLKESERILYIV